MNLTCVFVWRYAVTMNITLEQKQAAFGVILVLTEAIREGSKGVLGGVPNGELYALVCGRMTLQSYTSVLNTIKGTGLVVEKNHLLTWVGPAF